MAYLSLNNARINTKFEIPPYTPTVLFLNNEQGGWWDPSDTTTMWQNSAGTSPVTTLGQPVGRILDKSLGGLNALGPELVTNGDFSNGTTGWTSNNGTIAVVNGELELTATATTNFWAAQTITTVAGRTYFFTATIYRKQASGTCRLTAASIADGTSITTSTPTFVSLVFVATAASTTVRFGGPSAVIGDKFAASNITVREVPGNHLVQTTDAARPTWQARANMFLRSEEFDNAVWTRNNFLAFGSGSVANTTATTDPLGGNTADLLVTAAATAVTRIFQSVNSVAGQQNTATWYVKKQAGSTVRWLRLTADQAPGSAWFDLDNGVFGTVNAGVTSVLDVSSNGWYRIGITYSATALDTTDTQFLQIAPVNSGTGTFVGDGTSGFYLWGADCRMGSSGTYQRVTTATNYEDIGLPRYLQFDGADDFLRTATGADINFTATDEMTVCVGIWKLNNTVSIVAELSTNTNSNVGSWYLVSGTDAGFTNGYTTISRGTASAASAQVGGIAPFLAPDKAVLTTLHSISGDLSRIRRMGVVGTDGTGDKGLGNFTTQPLFVGRRGGTTLPFNGRLSQLVIRNALTTDDTLANLERFVTTKTGVTLP